MDRRTFLAALSAAIAGGALIQKASATPLAPAPAPAQGPMEAWNRFELIQLTLIARGFPANLLFDEHYLPVSDDDLRKRAEVRTTHVTVKFAGRYAERVKEREFVAVRASAGNIRFDFVGAVTRGCYEVPNPGCYVAGKWYPYPPFILTPEERRETSTLDLALCDHSQPAQHRLEFRV